MRRGASCIVIVAVIAWALPAAAERPGDYLHRSPPLRRSGFMVGAGVGPALITGGDFEGVHASGAATLRVGTTAGDNWLFVLQLDHLTFSRNTSDADIIAVNDASIASQSVLALGVQVYLRQVIWVKALLGTARLVDREQPNIPAKEPLGGLAMVGSVGYDVFRRGRWVLDLESTLALARYEDDGDAVDGDDGAAMLSLVAALSWY